VATTSLVVVDTNILFSALLSSQSKFTEILLTSEHQFYVCELVLVELFKHKQKIVRLSRLSEDDVVRVYHVLLRRLTVYKEDLIAPEHRTAAYALCSSIDATDTPHVALTLELGGLLWTGDHRLKEGLKHQGFDKFFEPTM
jgi:predicted nucleic acid-binding protein